MKLYHSIDFITYLQRNVNNKLLEWESPEGIKRQLPYYHSGYDYDGNPVLVFAWGKWEFQAIAEKGGEAVTTASMFLNQIEARIQSGFFKESSLNETGDNSKRVQEVVVILDFDGLKLSQFSSPAAIKFMLQRAASMEKIYNYIAYGFIINGNHLADQVLNLSKPLFGNFLEKVEIYGTNSRRWMPEIFKRIPRSQLPQIYGGYANFKPVAFYG